MEEPSNGKIEETQIVERQEVAEEVDVVESGAKFVVKDVIDGTSESVKETLDGNNSSLEDGSSSKEEAEAKEKNAQVEDSGMLEVVEKEVVNSVLGSTEFVESVEEKLTETIEASAEKFENSDVVEVEVKETEEKVSVSLNETDVIPPVVTDQTDVEVPEVVFNATDGLSSAVTDELSSGNEEKVLLSFDENNVAPPALSEAVSKRIEEEKLAVLEKNTGESSGNVDKETVESVESTNVVASSDAFPESTRDPPIISLQQRNLRPSWKSCCGLFEALRRSNR